MIVLITIYPDGNPNGDAVTNTSIGP